MSGRLLSAALIAGFALAGCDGTPPDTRPPPPIPKSDFKVRYVPAGFGELEGWQADDFAGFLDAFRISCEALSKRPDSQIVAPAGVGGTAADWKPVCREAGVLDTGAGPDTIRAFVTGRFAAYRIEGPGAPDPKAGKFTGYYEIELAGAEKRTGKLTMPVFAPPSDLVTAQLGDFDPALAGRRISGRARDGKLVPYDTRAVIEAPGWPARVGAEVLFWGDPVDVFFLQVQGSGVVRYEGGKSRRIGYAADNGHRFVGIGGLMLRRKLIGRGEASAQGVRAWLRRNPGAAAKLMAENPRFIFFRWIEGPGPIGAMGVPLTPGRSLAVDPRAVPLGAPVWLATKWPGDGAREFQRLMVAQDTGGAIKGAVRGDIYFGTGETALELAGRMNHPGRYFVLVPKTVKLRLEPEADSGS